MISRGRFLGGGESLPTVWRTKVHCGPAPAIRSSSADEFRALYFLVRQRSACLGGGCQCGGSSMGRGPSFVGVVFDHCLVRDLAAVLHRTPCRSGGATGESRQQVGKARHEWRKPLGRPPGPFSLRGRRSRSTRAVVLLQGFQPPKTDQKTFGIAGRLAVWVADFQAFMGTASFAT